MTKWKKGREKTIEQRKNERHRDQLVLNMRCYRPWNNTRTHTHTQTLWWQPFFNIRMLSNRFRFKLVLTATVQHMNFKLTAMCGVPFFFYLISCVCVCAFSLSICLCLWLPLPNSNWRICLFLSCHHLCRWMNVCVCHSISLTHSFTACLHRVPYSAVNLNLMHLCVLVRSIHVIRLSIFFSLERSARLFLSLSRSHCEGEALALVSVCRLLDQFSMQRAEFQHILICINICICAHENPFWCYVFYTP